MRINSVSAKKNIGSIIKDRRIKKGVSQNELANIAGITQTFLSLVEHGKRIPSYDVLKKIAKALGENASYLATEAGNAELDSVIKLNTYLRRILGSGNKSKVNKLLEFIETLG